jgi:hypothetical protein
MIRLRLLRAAPAVLVLLGIPACSVVQSVKGFLSGGSGPANVNDLVEAVEEVEAELDASKGAMLASVQALQKVTAPDFQGDAVKAYDELESVFDASDDQAETLRKSIESMQADAEPVFDQWTKDLEAYSNPELRQRSQVRLAAARERYDAVVAAVEPVLVEYEAINETLRDHLLFLSHDMNVEALSAIQEDVRKVAKNASDLDGAFNSGRAAARAYIESSAQPKAPTPEKAVPVKGS